MSLWARNREAGGKLAHAARRIDDRLCRWATGLVQATGASRRAVLTAHAAATAALGLAAMGMRISDRLSREWTADLDGAGAAASMAFSVGMDLLFVGWLASMAASYATGRHRFGYPGVTPPEKAKEMAGRMMLAAFAAWGIGSDALSGSGPLEWLDTACMASACMHMYLRAAAEPRARRRA